MPESELSGNIRMLWTPCYGTYKIIPNKVF